jgi:hypothetical protein
MILLSLNPPNCVAWVARGKQSGTTAELHKFKMKLRLCIFHSFLGKHFRSSGVCASYHSRTRRTKLDSRTAGN